MLTIVQPMWSWKVPAYESMWVAHQKTAFMSTNLNWQCDPHLSISFLCPHLFGLTQASGWPERIGLSPFTKVTVTWGSWSLGLKASVQIRSLWPEWQIPCPWEACSSQAPSEAQQGVEHLRTSEYACVSGHLIGSCMHRQKPGGWLAQCADKATGGEGASVGLQHGCCLAK